MPLSHFVEIIRTNPFKKKVTIFSLNLGPFQEMVARVDAPVQKSTYGVMKYADTSSSLSEKTVFTRCPYLVLREIESKRDRSSERQFPKKHRAIFTSDCSSSSSNFSANDIGCSRSSRKISICRRYWSRLQGDRAFHAQ